MITPKDLKEKALRPFYKIVSSQLREETTFPWTIPSDKKISGSNFSDWKNDLVPLYQHSKEVKGRGYSVEWKKKTINGSSQSIPSKIFFETFEDYLFFIGKNNDFLKINKVYEALVSEYPQLKNWAQENIALLLENFEYWEDILKVCNYMQSTPPPHDLYVRELPIAVHSKFIEDNTSLLKKILDIILPAEWISNSEKDFASRYFLKKPNIHTQIRVLDDDLKSVLGYEECSLPLDDAAWLKWLPQKVFIIENKVCYLTFPKVKGAVAIFGEGFKSRLSRHIPWLEKTNLYCWFDLDAAGFEMLNMIRQHYPNAKSFLMDELTYKMFDKYAVHKTNKRKDLPFLVNQEKLLYYFLTENSKRLEQERIVQSHVEEQLLKID